MRSTDVLAIAVDQIRSNKLRSFFTLLGISVSVAFRGAGVAIMVTYHLGQAGLVASLLTS
jgi:hypothetical protein